MRVRSCALLGCLVLACGSPPVGKPTTAPSEPRTEQTPPLELGALHELVPAAGLRWMLSGEPKALMAKPALRAAVLELLPAERLDRYARNTGVDLREVPSAVIAGFDLGTLYLAQVPGGKGHEARSAFVDRLGGREVVERPHPRVVRAFGTLDGVPHGFVDLDGRIVALATGDLTLSRIPVAFALRKLHKTRPALQGASLSTLPKLGGQPLVTFYAPGPFDGEWARAAGGVLAAALALAITLEAVDESYLRLTLVVSGDWQEGGQAAADALQAAFLQLSSSSTGKLFALERARAVHGSFHPQYLTLSAELPIDPLVRGLRAAVVADVWEILDLPPPRDSSGGRVP